MNRLIMEIKYVIFESYSNDMISNDELITLLESLVEKEEELGFIDEGFKDSVAKIAKAPGNEVKKAVNKLSENEKFKKVSDSYNKGMNSRATFVAKKIVKDPTRNGKKEVEPQVYDKYQKDLLKWRATYKTAEILATGMIAMGPFDPVVKAATFSAMARSNDPVDKAALELVDKVKNKIADIKRKVAGKKMSEKELNSEISALDRNTSALAKVVDKLRGNKAVPVAESVTESLYEKLDEYILDSNRHITESGMLLLLEFIDDTEIATEHALTILDHYLDM